MYRTSLRTDTDAPGKRIKRCFFPVVRIVITLQCDVYFAVAGRIWAYIWWHEYIPGNQADQKQPETRKDIARHIFHCPCSFVVPDTLNKRITIFLKYKTIIRLPALTKHNKKNDLNNIVIHKNLLLNVFKFIFE